MMEEIVYFEINNWSCGDDYPDMEKWESWLDLGHFKFRDEEWLKENGLCVIETVIDMSVNLCITAKRSWVEKECPELLVEPWSKFLRYEEDGEPPYSQFGMEFLPWREENFGNHYEKEPGDE